MWVEVTQQNVTLMEEAAVVGQSIVEQAKALNQLVAHTTRSARMLGYRGRRAR